jgi:hypothetical protein
LEEEYRTRLQAEVKRYTELLAAEKEIMQREKRQLEEKVRQFFENAEFRLLSPDRFVRSTPCRSSS